MTAVDQRRIDSALGFCYDAVVDPASWSDALHRLARSFDSVCCMFYPERPDDILHRMPASHDFKDLLNEFVRDGWWKHDHRAERFWPQLHAGRTVLLEHDIASDDERRTLPQYHELYNRYGMPWWAAIGFNVSGRQWGLPILRSDRAGPFTPADAVQLKGSIPHLSRMISLSGKLTLGRVASALDALDRAHVSAFALDWRGRVIRMNALAEGLVGNGIRLADGRLEASDRDSDTRLQRLLAAAVAAATEEISAISWIASAQPVPIWRFGRRPLVVETMPARGLFADALYQARALVMVTDLDAAARQPSTERIRSVLDVTRAEARLLSCLSAGVDLTAAAAALGISPHTARSQIKSLFAKTDTHRQAELVSIAQRIGGPVRSIDGQ